MAPPKEREILDSLKYKCFPSKEKKNKLFIFEFNKEDIKVIKKSIKIE